MSAKRVTSKLASRSRHVAGRSPRHAKTRAVTIVGRRWFDRANGNTYYSSEIYVNGKFVHKIPFAYGYGSMYEQDAAEWLIDHGYIKAEKYASGGYPPLWQLAEKLGFHKETPVSDVARKKDL